MSTVENNVLHYDFGACRDLALNSPRSETKYETACKYFHDRVFYTSSGNVHYYSEGKLLMCAKSDFEANQMIGFELKFKRAIQQNIYPYTEITGNGLNRINKERRTVDVTEPIYAELLKSNPSKETDDYVKFAVEVYLKQIICKNDEIKFLFLCRCIAKILRGYKLCVAIVLVTASQGVGKSTLACLIRNMLGVNHCATPSLEQVAKFNYGLYGKRLVLIEETEKLKQDTCVNEVLKNLITSNVYTYEKKGVQAEQKENVNSIIITSNHPLPSGDERRFFNLQISTEWLKDTEKWTKLMENVNDDCIRALYDFFMQFDISNFNEQRELYKLKDEVGGDLKSIQSMSDVFRFMKENYALEKKSGTISCYKLYKEYCSKSVRPYSKDTFYNHLDELNILKKVEHNQNVYVIEGEKLLKEFQKRNLIHEDDFLELTEKRKEEKNIKALDGYMLETIYVLDMAEKEIEIQSLKKEIEALKEMLKNKTEENKEPVMIKSVVNGKKKIQVIASKV